MKINEVTEPTFNVGDEVRIDAPESPDHMEAGKVVKVNTNNGNGVDHKIVYVRLNRMKGVGDTKMFWACQLSLEHPALKHGQLTRPRTPPGGAETFSLPLPDGGIRRSTPGYNESSNHGKTNIAEEGITGGKLGVFTTSIVTWWNSGLHPENTLARIYSKDPGFRVWTRGDGTRYRDPARILSYDDSGTAIDQLWDALSNLKISVPAGAVSQEFPSLGKQNAIKIKSYTLVKRENCIDVMTKGRVKNPNSVWKQDATVSEESDPYAGTSQEREIKRLEKHIKTAENNAGWGDNANSQYDRDWKKKLSADKKKLATLKKSKVSEASSPNIKDINFAPKYKKRQIKGLTTAIAKAGSDPKSKKQVSLMKKELKRLKESSVTEATKMVDSDNVLAAARQADQQMEWTKAAQLWRQVAEMQSDGVHFDHCIRKAEMDDEKAKMYGDGKNSNEKKIYDEAAPSGEPIVDQLMTDFRFDYESASAALYDAKRKLAKINKPTTYKNIRAMVDRLQTIDETLDPESLKNKHAVRKHNNLLDRAQGRGDVTKHPDYLHNAPPGYKQSFNRRIVPNEGVEGMYRDSNGY